MTASGAATMLTLKQVIEALIFASPKPLTLEEIRKALREAAAETDDLNVIALGDTSEEDVASHLNLLRAEYEQTGRAFQIMEQANGWTIVTVSAAVEWVRQLYPETRPTRLSGPALETLAIIAYRQPVTRADIEAVRGVAVDGVMQVLLDRQLVKIAGRAELPGRPLLYETTEYFLQHFGIKEVEELPNSDELRRVNLPKPEYGEDGAEKPSRKKKKIDLGLDGATSPAPPETPPGLTPAPEPPVNSAAENTEPAPPADPMSDAAVSENFSTPPAESAASSDSNPA